MYSTLMGKNCDTGILILIFEEGKKYLGGIYQSMNRIC